MRKAMRNRALLIAALLMCAAPAAALGPSLDAIIRADDVARLDQLDPIAGRTLRDALAQGSADDRAVLVAGLSGAALPDDQAGAILPGDWSCRMLKLGGGLALVVYQPFQCRIDADGKLVKLTGSQRMTGRIGPVAGRLTYLGTGHVAGETPLPYDALPPQTDPAASPQLVPEAGLVEVTGRNTARILMPAPVLESDLNILLLSR